MRANNHFSDLETNIDQIMQGELDKNLANFFKMIEDTYSLTIEGIVHKYLNNLNEDFWD